VRGWRDWAEEHWATVGIVASIAGALTFSVILAVVFNVITTRLDGLHSGAATARNPERSDRSSAAAQCAARSGSAGIAGCSTTPIVAPRPWIAWARAIASSTLAATSKPR